MNNINELTAKCHQIIEDAKARHKDVQIYAPVLRWSEFMMLIEALEAAEERNAEMDSELEREREKSRRMASHIAELEARTLTVKLPPVMRIEEPGLSFNAYGQSGVQNALYEACAAAGIKLQIEGE